MTGAPALLPRRRFTVEEFLRMGETGILDGDERVELIEGEIVEMTPVGRDHASVVDRLVTLFVSRLGQRVNIRGQGPVVLPGLASQLQPDVALLRRKRDFYRSAHPEPGDVLLIIEVMDTTIHRDRRIKLPLYARAGVREVWLIDVNSGTVEIHRRPAGRTYRDRRVLTGRATATPLAFPALKLSLPDLLG